MGEHLVEEVVVEVMVQVREQVVQVEQVVEDKCGFTLGNKNIYNKNYGNILKNKTIFSSK
jgi:hypothetical protein